MTKLFERVRSAREQKGLSKAALARSIGVNASAVVQWENQKGTTPNAGNMAKVAKVLEVAHEWLATGRGPSRVVSQNDASAIDMATFAYTLFEERLLELSRSLAPRCQEPLIRFLESVVSEASVTNRRRKSSAP